MLILQVSFHHRDTLSDAKVRKTMEQQKESFKKMSKTEKTPHLWSPKPAKRNRPLTVEMILFVCDATLMTINGHE